MTALALILLAVSLVLARLAYLRAGCAVGRHERGGLATLHRGADGRTYWTCVRCGSPVPSAVDLAPTLSLPSPHAVCQLERVGLAPKLAAGLARPGVEGGRSC